MFQLVPHTNTSGSKPRPHTLRLGEHGTTACLFAVGPDLVGKSGEHRDGVDLQREGAAGIAAGTGASQQDVERRRGLGLEEAEAGTLEPQVAEQGLRKPHGSFTSSCQGAVEALPCPPACASPPRRRVHYRRHEKNRLRV